MLAKLMESFLEIIHENDSWQILKNLFPYDETKIKYQNLTS